MGAACLSCVAAAVIVGFGDPVPGVPGHGAPASAYAQGAGQHVGKVHRRVPFSRSRARRAELRRSALRNPRLTLKSSFIHRAAVAALVLPTSLRLKRPYEGGPGDDVLELAWDDGAVPWPLDGTIHAGAPATSHLAGAATYDWDYGADTSGYSELGTVETRIGRELSLTGDGFPIAQQDGSCTTVAALDATGMTITSAGVRFGTVNPFSGRVNGTINLRTTIRTAATPCGGGAAASAIAATTAGDPPLPVAFTGTFSVSPGVSADGSIRLGILRVDASTMPQRTTFGLVHVCTDPTAPDGCARQAFPVRTRLLSFNAEVLLGATSPAPPVMPDPPAAPAPSSSTPPSTGTPASTDTPPATDPGAAVVAP